MSGVHGLILVALLCLQDDTLAHYVEDCSHHGLSTTQIPYILQIRPVLEHLPFGNVGVCV